MLVGAPHPTTVASLAASCLDRAEKATGPRLAHAEARLRVMKEVGGPAVLRG